MPLPTPNSGESQDAFISRCMGNPTMNSEYPEQDQRAAVCYSQWRRKQGEDYPWDECIADQLAKGHDMESAKKICGYIKAQNAHVFTYLAAIHSPMTKNGENFAKIRLIDTSTSKPSQPLGERWRVTYEGLKKAVQKLLRDKHLPLIGPPEKGHNATVQMGEPVDFYMPDGYADVTFKITDPKAWEAIKKREWRAASPQVRVYKQEKGPEGEAVCHDFDFEHLAFVDEGAFPAVTVQNFWSAEMLHTLRAELHGNRNVTDGASNLPLNLGMQDADQTKAKTIGGTQMSEEDPNKALKEENAKLKASIADLTQKLERPTPVDHYKQRNEALEKQVTELEAWKQTKLNQEKDVKVARVVEQKIVAGQIHERDRAAEIEKLKGMSPEALDAVSEVLSLKVAEVETQGPKAKFSGSSRSDSLEDRVYQQQFGRARPDKLKEFD